MLDYLYIGPTPPDEPCAQLGEENYAVAAKKECRAYIEALRKKLGNEPEGARLFIKSNDHDFGTYYEVCCEYDTDIPESLDYALKCEGYGPTTWAEVGMVAPTKEPSND